MAKYRELLEMKGCIGAATCAAVHPERWKMINNNNKVTIIGGKKIPGSEDEEIIIDDSELEKFKQAAEVCPVNVIHIKNLDTGEEII
mgnify:CR=1 FL=1